MRISFNKYRYQVSNNFEILHLKDDKKNTSTRNAFIIISCCIHIKPICFYKDNVL